MRKDCSEEVTSKLSLKGKEKSAGRSAGKDMPSRRNRMCKASDSRGADIWGYEHRSVWLEGGRGGSYSSHKHLLSTY